MKESLQGGDGGCCADDGDSWIADADVLCGFLLLGSSVIALSPPLFLPETSL